MRADDPAAERIQREIFIRTRLARLAEPGIGSLVASFAEEVTYSPGAVLYREGEPPRDFYAFVRGSVEVVAGRLPPWHVTDQSGIGLLDVLANQPRNATVTAVTQVRAMKILADDYLDFLEQHFEFAVMAALRAARDVHDLSLSLAPDGGFPAATKLVATPRLAPAAASSLVQKIEVLRLSRAFGRANVQALVRLALLAREIHLDAGDTLFQRGRAKGLFFLVAEGVIEAVHEAPALVAGFGRGDLVCGFGALGDADNQYVATASSRAVVLSFSEEDFFDVMEEHFQLTRSVLAGIASDYTLLSLERERRAEKSAGP